MRQTTLCVPLEVKPESCIRLSSLIDAMTKLQDGDGHFAQVARFVPTLHFMSMSVFPASEYDPLFILEANFDGDPGPFWAQLEAAPGMDLRAMLRCCKRPLDGDGPLYDAVTQAGSRAPVAPYLQARTQRPSVFHQGNRGLSCARILAEHRLFLALRDLLDDPLSQVQYHTLAPPELHCSARAALLPRYAWLAQPVPPRIGTAESISDYARMAGFVLAVMLALSAPGLLLAAMIPWRAYLLLIVLTGLVLGGLAYRNRAGLPGTEVHTRFRLSGFLLRQTAFIATAAAGFMLAVTLLADPVVWLASHVLHALSRGHALSPDPPLTLGQAFWPIFRVVGLGLAGLVLFTLPLLLVVLRHNEMRDSAQDAPQTRERMLRDMLAREDWTAQNHMGSIVLIKPGILRTIIIRVGHAGLGLVLRVVARDGYLGSMRTVHFAHWAFLNNSSRLLFMSNFDHSWGSYLDDFIEKAHTGLTLAWGSSVGFPATRFLVYDGASHGRQFKAWALASRAVSRFWYSAYPALTVDQIERNTRIAAGLRRDSLRDQEARAWMQDL